MNINTVKYQKINETMHIYEHPSGLKVFVIPKKGYLRKFATFATHYGSINSEFSINGEDTVKVPDGIAHFLEHKLFEQKDGSVMDKFSKLGSSPNAYTGFSQTVYLFSCTDNFSDNFNLLLNFVQNPYITEESVEKEKGIIAQEIKMYDDDPGWRSFFNLLGAFYKNHPVKIEIAGTVESIRKINRDTLYSCYNTFYHPSNMVIVVVGDVEPESVFAQVEDSIRPRENTPQIQRIFPDEPKTLNKSYAEQRLAVSTPQFQAGFKDNTQNLKGIDYLMREVTVKLLFEMIMGKSSELYNQLYSEGLINSTFEFDYTIEENYAFSLFGGESTSPEKVRDRVAQEYLHLSGKGLDRSGYERIIRAMKGKYIKQLNSVDRISNLFISSYFKEANIFNYFDAYDKITFEYVSEIFREHFNLENLALSVIKPV